MKVVVYLMIFFYLFESFLFASRVDDGSEDTGSAVIFMYHRFGEKTYPSTNIRLEQFEYQLNYLKDNYYNVWPLSKILSYMIDKKKIPPKTVAISMDDAYRSVYTKAYQRLKEKHFPFTVFVNTFPIDRKSKNYMSWDQMREMSKNGAEFANHTLTHPFLLKNSSESTEEWTARVKKEVTKAQERLQQELGSGTNENPKMLAYPFGEYSEQTVGLIKSLGYVGVSQTSGPVDQNTDLMAITRFPMSESFATEQGFLLKLNTLPLPIRSVLPTQTLIEDENPPTLHVKLRRPLKDMLCYTSNGDKIDMKWISDTEAEVKAKSRLLPPRDHYTCTARAEEGKWYWYSHLWVFKK